MPHDVIKFTIVEAIAQMLNQICPENFLKTLIINTKLHGCMTGGEPLLRKDISCGKTTEAGLNDQQFKRTLPIKDIFHY